MPKFSKPTDHAGIVTVDTDVPREIAELKATGFREDAPTQEDAPKAQAPKPAVPPAAPGVPTK